jgi:predicted alpha/beta-fold hydrolase
MTPVSCLYATPSFNSCARLFRKMGVNTELISDERRVAEQAAREFLFEVARGFAAKSFKPHRLFKNGHAQTLAGYAWPRRFRLKSPADQERLFEVAPGIKVLAHCRWQATPSEHATLVLWHGIEGSTSSIYMLGTADKAFRAGFNVVRVNVRNCGGTEHLTPTLYHGGLSGDLRAVVNQLIEHDRLPQLFVIGFSLGGNMALKFAAECGEDPPRELLAVCAVSPAVDLAASMDLLIQRSNWIYHRNILGGMRKRIRTKKRLFPELYDLSEIGSVRTIRDFDNQFTAPAYGFADADDYYQRESSIPLIDRIRIPTLIIHAEDDPFIPFAPLRHPSVVENPYILLIATKWGGHVAFVAERKDGEDRFWAENRVVQFCTMAKERLGKGDEVGYRVNKQT